MTAELSSAVEAFRAILRAKCPEREDLQRIDSYRWFHERQRILGHDPIASDNVFDHLFCRSTLLAAPADRPAYEALSLLRNSVATGKIRLRGVLNTALPADIDPIDIERGELDVFEGTLTVELGDIFNSKRVYTSVYVYAGDLPLPKDDEQLAVTSRRYPSDAALIEEGVQMAFAGKQYRAIARDLAPRADGNATLESKEDRLRTAISKEHKRRLGGL